MGGTQNTPNKRMKLEMMPSDVISQNSHESFDTHTKNISNTAMNSIIVEANRSRNELIKNINCKLELDITNAIELLVKTFSAGFVDIDKQFQSHEGLLKFTLRENIRIKEELTVAKNKCEELEIQTDVITQISLVSESEVEVLEKKLETSLDSIQTLQNNITHAKKENKELKTTVIEKETKIKDLRHKHEAMEKVVQSSFQEQESVVKQLDETIKMMQEKNETIKNSDEIFSELETKLDEAYTNVRTLKTKLEKSKSLINSARQSGQAAVAAMQGKLEKLDRSYKMSNDFSAELSSQLSLAKQQHLHLKNQIADERKQLLEENETVKKQFERYLGSNESDLACSICLKIVINSTTINCGHIFCGDCIETWRKKSNSCPKCRSKIHIQLETIQLDAHIEKFTHRYMSAEYVKERNLLLEERKRKGMEDQAA